MSADPIDFLGSPQGREAIEAGAIAAFAIEWPDLKWDDYEEDDGPQWRALAEAVLASALRGVSCDTCGGSGQAPCDCDERGRTHRQVCDSWLRCRDCKGSGFRPGVLVPREELEREYDRGFGDGQHDVGRAMAGQPTAEDVYQAWRTGVDEGRGR